MNALQPASKGSNSLRICGGRRPEMLKRVAKAIECPNEGCRLVDNYQRADGDVLARDSARQNARPVILSPRDHIHANRQRSLGLHAHVLCN